MDLWTDLNSGAEWGLDLLSQQSGLFGDLNEVSHLDGDKDPACKPGDAVEQIVSSPGSDGPLDFEWMESGDLGSFLDALDKGQNRLSVQDSVFDYSLGLNLKDNINVVDGQVNFFPPVSGVDSLNQILTPPESPEQITPIIKLDPDIYDRQLKYPNTAADPTQDIILSVERSTTPEPSSVIIHTPVDLLDDQIDIKPDLLDVSDILGLPFVFSDTGAEPQSVDSTDDADLSFTYSSDDASSISSPLENSPPRPSIDSLIQSSPELYKVIAAPSDLSTRFSPYCKSKAEQKSKGSSKKSKSEKQLPEILPEEFVSSGLGKKERKKLQNKNAAIRYRQKKKAEVECIATEVQGLEDKNHELKTKVDDLRREVKYMKSLMEDIYRAKGLVK